MGNLTTPEMGDCWMFDVLSTLNSATAQHSTTDRWLSSPWHCWCKWTFMFWKKTATYFQYCIASPSYTVKNARLGEGGSLCHDFKSFIYTWWCRISDTNSTTIKVIAYYAMETLYRYIRVIYASVCLYMMYLSIYIFIYIVNYPNDLYQKKPGITKAPQTTEPKRRDISFWDDSQVRAAQHLYTGSTAHLAERFVRRNAALCWETNPKTLF